MIDKNPDNNFPTGYQVPEVWSWETGNGGQFQNINRPTAGARFEKELPIGEHPLQLYSQGTPNGVKVTILLEELLALGHSDAEYDAWLINIFQGDQFGSGFVELNPNSKIPALLDRSTEEPTRVFESGSILLYLARKFDAFLPKDPKAHTEALNWLFWQVGAAPFVGGGFGHFFSYAPIHIKYAIDRFAMEVKRQFDVIDRHLEKNRFFAGDEYSIADMAVWPWYGAVSQNDIYNTSGTFLATDDYLNFQRWRAEIAQRPAVQRGRMVNRTVGKLSDQLQERHNASDFHHKTQDKAPSDTLCHLMYPLNGQCSI